MQLVLSLDTSTPVLSCALLRRRGAAGEAAGLRVLAVREAGPPKVVSTLVPGLFDELLQEAGAALADIGVFVTGRGPGLFTGVRVAMATMKAASYARRVPLCAAGTLEALSLAAGRGGSALPGDVLEARADDSPLLCPVLDARKGELYFALQRWRGGALETVLPARASTPADLLAQLRERNEPARVFGTGVPVVRAALGDASLPIEFLSNPAYPGAAEVAALALARDPAPVFDEARLLSLEPDYLRPPEAEAARLRRAGA